MQEFPCQQLNRDVWSNEAVRNVIKENFVLWQVGYLFVVFFGGRCTYLNFSENHECFTLYRGSVVSVKSLIKMFFFSGQWTWKTHHNSQQQLLSKECILLSPWQEIKFHSTGSLFHLWVDYSLDFIVFFLQFWQYFFLF